jgi:hypothetical protein
MKSNGPLKPSGSISMKTLNKAIIANHSIVVQRAPPNPSISSMRSVFRGYMSQMSMKVTIDLSENVEENECK